MKKLFTLALLSLSTFQNIAHAQFWEDEEPKKPSLLQKGDLMFTGFVSYPNFGRFTARVALANADFYSASTSGFAPLGVQGEFMLTNTFGISLDLFANQWGATWRETSDPSSFTYSVSTFRFRGLIGLNYHLEDLDNEKLNVYGGAALGYNYRQFSFKTDDMSSIGNFWETSIDFPLAFRARAGLRYFVSDNLGLNIELGTGGPIMRFGLTARIASKEGTVNPNSKM